MPVVKFRSVADMPDAARGDVTDPGYWDRLVNLYKLAAQLGTVRFPPGVTKHRSVEEAQLYRERTTLRTQPPRKS